VDYEKMQLLLTKMNDKKLLILQDIKRREDENDKYFQKVTFLDEQLLQLDNAICELQIELHKFPDQFKILEDHLILCQQEKRKLKDERRALEVAMGEG
jgi:chromosome segregation ATPase